MQAVIVSDDEALAVKIRRVLLRDAHDCPAANVVRLEAGGRQVVKAHPDLVIVAASSDGERTLAVVSEVRLLTEGGILVVGSTAEARFVLQALRRGASDFVDVAELESDLKAALSRLGAELPDSAEAGRTIAILGPSGGSGSSTLAVNVATVLAK